MVTDSAAIDRVHFSYAGKASQASTAVGEVSKDCNDGSNRSRVAVTPETWPCLLA
jgi:hypothetical protein